MTAEIVQKDIYGNPVELTEHERRAHLNVTEYTRNLCRQFAAVTPLEMQETVEVSLKILAAVRKMKITQEDIDKIKKSKDIEEIINILSNSFKNSI